jgi:hypothetical protein
LAISASQPPDPSVTRLDAAPPPPDPSADAAVPDQSAPPQEPRRKRKARRAPDNVTAEEAGDDSAAQETPKRSARKDSPARNYRKAAAENPFLEKFPTSSGHGIKLGAAVTIAAMVIQGPYPREDRRYSADHLRHVMSGMLNVYSPATLASFVEMGAAHEQDQIAYCLQRVECARVTLQRSIPNLQKFINAAFGGPTGIGPEWRGRHLVYTIVT